jgi:hypothetical protein
VLLGVFLLLVLLSCKKADTSTAPPEAVDQAEAVSVEARGASLDTAEKIDLRILCTTSPKQDRTDDFVAFLSKHFVKVATTDYLEFREEQAEGYDVVIIDYGATRPGSPVPKLARGYARATVTMGVSGSMVCRRLGLKPGYL